MVHRTKRKRACRKYPVKTVVIEKTSSLDVEFQPTKSTVTCVSTSSQTDGFLALGEVRNRNLNLPELESVSRITNIPIVESGIHYAGNIYQKLKTSNSLLNWTLDQAESTVYSVVETAGPAIVLLQGPLLQVDKIVCKTLDMVEETVPSINLPPEMIISNTKQYAKEKVTTNIVKPVLQRANSVKQIGNTVLASKAAVFAADTLDGALNLADLYVDKYLPADGKDTSVDEVDKPADRESSKALHTIKHADRLGRKLKRRLTKRTMAEVKALKEQSAEAVHVLVYVAELVATDPVLAFKKGKELWANLSQDEPENQARPENLEQLIVLLTRESARRVVHLVNYTATFAYKINKNLVSSVAVLANRFLAAADSILKTAHLERVQRTTTSIMKQHAYSITMLMKQLNIHVTSILDNWAQKLESTDTTENHVSPPLQTALPVPQILFQSLKSFHVNSMNNKNGLEHNNSISSAGNNMNDENYM